MRKAVTERSGVKAVLIEAAERWDKRKTWQRRKKARAAVAKFLRIRSVQLKLFIVPVKNVNDAEVEMNAFLRGHRVFPVKK